MEWLNDLAQNSDAPFLAAFALGLLTAISPCTLATNITATAYIAKAFTSKRKVLYSGLLFTFGRMLSYSSLGAIIYFGMSKFQVATTLQSRGEKFVGPILIIIGLVMLDVLKLPFLSSLDITGRFSEKFKDKGLLGSFLLGVIFSLAFCPYSGALFFALLIPMTLTADAGMALPLMFSLGSGLPVVFFAVVMASGIQRLGKYFRAIKKAERGMRFAVGVVFLCVGLYYLNIFLGIF